MSDINCRTAVYTFVHYFLFEHFAYFISRGNFKVLNYKVFLCKEMLNKCVMFSNSKTIVWMIVISILTKIILITTFSTIKRPWLKVKVNSGYLFRSRIMRFWKSDDIMRLKEGLEKRRSFWVSGWWLADMCSWGFLRATLMSFSRRGRGPSFRMASWRGVGKLKVDLSQGNSLRHFNVNVPWAFLPGCYLKMCFYGEEETVSLAPLKCDEEHY